MKLFIEIALTTNAILILVAVYALLFDHRLFNRIHKLWLLLVKNS